MPIYPIQYTFKTVLAKEDFLLAVKENASTKKLLAHNLYLHYYSQNNRHYVEPQHPRPERGLRVVIEIATEDLQDDIAQLLVVLKFRLTPTMEWVIAGCFVGYLVLFVLAVIVEQTGYLTNGLIKWLFLAASITSIIIFPLFFYASLSRYIGAIKRV